MAKFSVNAEVLQTEQLNPTVWLMEVQAPEIAGSAKPGQFVTVHAGRSTDPMLRRPFGVAEVNREKGSVTLMYRVIGEATKAMAALKAGDSISVLGPLGRGFNTGAKHPLIVGGGLGLAPLLFLAEDGFGDGRADLLIGGRNAVETEYWQRIYAGKAGKIFVTTDDGSLGTKGTVMAELEKLLQQDYDCVYVCGPVPMMRAVAEAVLAAGKACQVSLERYMACGLGACLSCACENARGQRVKVCQNGPVFAAEEVKEW